MAATKTITTTTAATTTAKHDEWQHREEIKTSLGCDLNQLDECQMSCWSQAAAVAVAAYP